MGLLGTGADWASDALVLGEIATTILVFLGARSIRKGRHVGRHRRLMLSALVLNGFLLAGFLVVDLIKNQTVVGRSETSWKVFVPVLVIHLIIAVTALSLAITSWLIARRSTITHADGGLDLTPEGRMRHRRVSRLYPGFWYATLATGLLLYAVVYV